MLVADHIGHRPWLHPLEAVQPAGIAAQQDTIDQAARLVLTEGLGEHLADIAIGADTQAGLIADDLDELAHHLFDLRLLHIAHLRHGGADPLHLLRTEMAQNLRGIGFTQREQQDGCLVDLVELGGKSIVIHQR